jgi:uncharacterized protein (DUF2249 family)/quercetin dioxygenase-like cupin family protein
VPELELDVRPLPKPDKHPAIFRAYDALATGESLVLFNNHDPRHLRGEFDTDHPGSYAWEYLGRGPAQWRIRISKLASTPLPRILCDTAEVAAGAGRDQDAAGAVWKLGMGQRDLDSNIISLPPGGGITAHAGLDLDVLLLVLSGAGQLTTELGPVALEPGALAWLPRRSRREFTAGPDGLRYLTVHQRRQSLVLSTSAPGGE